MFCFCQLKLSGNHRNIKYCSNTVHTVNFSRELVLENATSGSLKVLEFHYQRIVGTLCTIAYHAVN